MNHMMKMNQTRHTIIKLQKLHMYVAIYLHRPWGYRGGEVLKFYQNDFLLITRELYNANQSYLAHYWKLQ